MISFYLSFSIILLICIGMFVYAFKVKNKLWFWTLVILTLGLALYSNPDIWNWYQYEKNTQAFEKAKAILKQPNQVKRLKQSLQAQVVKHPEDAKAWFLLGRMYASEGLWNQAHDAVFQAYRLEPNNLKTAIFYVETIWQTQGKITPQARYILNQVLKKDDHQPDALIMLAADANNRGCYQQAITYWQKILVMLPKDSEMAQVITEAISKASEKPENCH